MLGGNQQDTELVDELESWIASVYCSVRKRVGSGVKKPSIVPALGRKRKPSKHSAFSVPLLPAALI